MSFPTSGLMAIDPTWLATHRANPQAALEEAKSHAAARQAAAPDGQQAGVGLGLKIAIRATEPSLEHLQQSPVRTVRPTAPRKPMSRAEMNLLEAMLFGDKPKATARAARTQKTTPKKDQNVKYTVEEMLSAQARLASLEAMDRAIAIGLGTLEASATPTAELNRTTFSLRTLTPSEAKARLAQIEKGAR